MKKIALLNTSIVTVAGKYELKDITLEEARDLIAWREIDSAIGHQSTAEIMSKLLGINVPLNRQMFCQQPGQMAIVFKLNGRLDEGNILDNEDIERIGYKFQLLYREK